MKKFVLITLIVLVVLAGLIITAWHYLPVLGVHLLGRAINGSVEAASSRITYSNGLILLEMKGVRMRGNVEGTVGSCQIRLLPSKGIYVKYFGASDFDITVKKEKGTVSFYPVPVELAEIKKGLLTYGGQKFIVRELRVTNFNTGKNLEFSIDGGIEGLGNLKTRGEGIFREKRSDVKGDFFLSDVNLARMFKGYQGSADSRGAFTYRNESLTLDGDAHVPHFSMKERFLSKPLVSDNVTCLIHLVRTGETTDVQLKNLSYKGTPVQLDFTTKERKLMSLGLTTGFLGILELQQYIDFNQLSEKDWGPLSLIKGGEVRIDRFLYGRGKPFQAQLYLRDVEAGAENVSFREVEGALRLDGYLLSLSKFKGRFQDSYVYDLSGLVPLKLDRDVRIEGKFSARVPDLARLKSTDQIEVLSGTTEGTLEVRGRKDRGFAVGGAGVLYDGRFRWKGIALGVSGNYVFKDGDVSFDGVSVKGDGTSLLLSGKAGTGFASIQAKGWVDAEHIRRLAPGSYAMKGLMAVDAQVEVRGGAFRGAGQVAMTDLSFEIPRVMRKERGVESSANVSLRSEKGVGIIIDDLSYRLDVLKASLRGTITGDRVVNLKLTVDVPKIDRVSKLFFFDQSDAQGEVKMDVQIDDLGYPLVKLPSMKGFMTVRNGTFRLPMLAEPLKEIDLACDFKGEKFVVQAGHLRAGRSVLTGGRLEVVGLDFPVFSLRLEMEHVNPEDFAARRKGELRVPVIAENSLLARTSGTFSLKARDLQIRSLSGHDLLMEGTFGNRTLRVEDGGVVTNEGTMRFRGEAALSQNPRMTISGSVKNVKAEEVLPLFAAKKGVMEGTGSIDATLMATGTDGATLLRGLGGTVNVESSGGVIRKWNLLSKILALLNVYDLFRGRVDLTKEGLVYRKLGGLFEGRNGTFHTENFVIESPSMMITGRGDVDLGTRTMEGKVTVSPLVTVDKFIDRLPLVRHIFRERKEGFLFFVYDVKGPLKDPEVKSSYIQSVGARAFFILRNILKLPKKMLDQLPKEVHE